MRYFDDLICRGLDRLFFRLPEPFSKTTEPQLLRKAVGGLLYTPASNTCVAENILEGKIRGLTSLAVCLEDAVGEEERQACEENVGRQFEQLMQALDSGALSPDRLPLLFVRVKDNHMLERLSGMFAAYSRVLTGVILPKVTAENLERSLALADAVAAQAEQPFYAMPILESEELMLTGDRCSLLREQMAVMQAHPGRVLNVRVGATDLFGLYGIRRRVDTPIYQIPLLADCISDMVRIFGMEDRYTVSGPVWEYYSAPERSRALGHQAELEGLLREVHLDLQNGILGKTCIHPTQLLPVQACYAVPCEIYEDACAIQGGDRTGGVSGSASRNKMNEQKPHTLWAEKILQQARLYGVYRADAGPAELLRAAGELE